MDLDKIFGQNEFKDVPIPNDYSLDNLTKDVELIKHGTNNPQRKKIQSAVPKTMSFKPI